MLEVCYGYAGSKTKAHSDRKKTYTRASNPEEGNFVETIAPFPESLVGDWYWIGIVDNYNHYSWSFSTKSKPQLPKKME